jgi:hypothetical protein
MLLEATAMRYMTSEVKMMWARNGGVLLRLYSRWYERIGDLIASAASMQTTLRQMLDPRKQSPINGQKSRKIVYTLEKDKLLPRWTIDKIA